MKKLGRRGRFSGFLLPAPAIISTWGGTYSFGYAPVVFFFPLDGAQFRCTCADGGAPILHDTVPVPCSARRSGSVRQTFSCDPMPSCSQS
jgi:hypothetical protein